MGIRSWLSKLGKVNPNYLLLPSNLVYTGRAKPEDHATTDSLLVSLYKFQKISSIFRSVEEIATSVASVPFVLERQTEDGKTEQVHNHPFLDLLAEPNDLFLWIEFIKRTVAYRLLGGNVYWLIDNHSTLQGTPSQLHLPRPDKIEVSLDESGSRVFDVGQDSTWDSRWVIHFRGLNVISDMVGLSPLGPIKNKLSVTNYLEAYDKVYYENTSLFNYVLESEEGLDPASYERLKVELEETQGVGNFFGIPIYEKVKLKELTKSSHVDADISSHMQLMDRLVYLHFGCYHLMTLVEQPNRALLDKSIYLFWTQTVGPLLRELEQIIQYKLLRKHFKEPDLVCKFDTRAISGFREDINDESMRDFRYLQSGVLTPNDVRNKRDIGSRVDWGDLPLYGKNQFPDFAASRMESNEVRSVGQIKRLIREVIDDGS